MKNEGNVEVVFKKEHIPTLIAALDMYSRAKCRQLDIVLRDIADTRIPWANFELVSQLLFNTIPDVLSLDDKKAGDAGVAYEIHKVLTQYSSVTNNDGYFTWGRCFDDPITYSNIDLPIVKGFSRSKVIPITNAELNAALRALEDKKNYAEMWQLVAENLTYPQGQHTELKWFPKTQSYKVIVFKPRRKEL